MNVSVPALYGRKDGENMDARILADYAERVFLYAVRRTYTADEAEELSQEILCTAVHSISGLRDESRFEPWLWGLAANVTRSFRRSMGRQHAMFVCDMPEEPEDRSEEERNEEEEKERLYSSLRSAIASLSHSYRDILILHYYDGLSTKETAARLGIPEGTVTWRLSEARRKLKKELEKMEETALRPRKMKINYFGYWDGDARYAPVVFVRDALAENILYHCYEKPQSVEDLSRITGVPAYYIEDRIADLTARNALAEVSRGRYGTNFIILSDREGSWFEQHAERAIGSLCPRFADAMDALIADAEKIPFHRGDRSEDNLRCLFWFMASVVYRTLWNPFPVPEAPLNYDGQRWGYLGDMRTDAHPPLRISSNACLNNIDPRGRFRHDAFGGIAGIKTAGPGWHTWINACEDILKTGSSEDREATAACVREGYAAKREDGTFYLKIPAFTIEQKQEFDGLVRKHLGPYREAMTSAALDLADGYRAFFPTRLSEQAKMPIYWLFQQLFAVVMNEAIKSGKLIPCAAGEPCDVLTQFRE